MPDSQVPDDIPDDADYFLLPTARAAIGRALGLPPEPSEEPPAWVLAPGASFVTLTEDGALRGCIGSLEAVRPLVDDVRANAVAAATRDPRFPPVTPIDLGGIAIEVSVLSSPRPLSVSNLDDACGSLRPHVDGVIVECGPQHRATFLPQVWEELPHPDEFLLHLWMKAGLPPGVWHDGTTLQTYAVRAWREGT